MKINCSDQSQNQKLQSFLKDTPLPSSWTLEVDATGKPSLHTEAKKPFFLDMSQLTPLNSQQPFAKAIGKEKSKILDITAGWGYDSYLLALKGHNVLGLEKHKLVFLFLDFFQKNSDTSLHLKFLLTDSFLHLEQLEDKPDVIYMDPMFGINQKGKSAKPLHILQTLTDTKLQDPQKLFELACKKSKKKVVVKRHQKEQPFSGHKLHSFSGRAICFDVFSSSV